MDARRYKYKLAFEAGHLHCLVAGSCAQRIQISYNSYVRM